MQALSYLGLLQSYEELVLFLPLQRIKLRCLDIQAFARVTSSGSRPNPPALVLHVTQGLFHLSQPQFLLYKESIITQPVLLSG